MVLAVNTVFLVLLNLLLVRLVKGLQSWTIDVKNVDIGYDDRKGVFQLTRLPYNPLQEASCYEYKLFSRWNTSEVLSSKEFCYPSIMITGHFKCSTSALFALISKAVNVNTTREKEQCVSGNLLEYFNRLPGPDYGNGHLLSGCLSLRENTWTAAVLRRPRTYYIVLTRDFSNLMWSAYNFWCNPAVEYCGLPTQWVEPGKQNRSTSLFHDLVSHTLNGENVPNPMFYLESMSPCTYGHAAYLRMISQLWTISSVARTLIVASEDLEQNLLSTVKLLTKALDLGFEDRVLEKFSRVRYNTQVAKGPDSVVNSSVHLKQVYPASNYEPLMPSTRRLLDECWLGDCQITSYLTGYNYSSCSHRPLRTVRSADGHLKVDLREAREVMSEELRSKDLFFKISAYRKYIDSLLMKTSIELKNAVDGE